MLPVGPGAVVALGAGGGGGLRPGGPGSREAAMGSGGLMGGWSRSSAVRPSCPLGRSACRRFSKISHIAPSGA
jgi:hypothetical protein